MKRFVAILWMLSFAICAGAQWLDSDVYDRPLEDVLDDIRKTYNVQLTYKEKNVRNVIVKSAPWRFAIDVETTLDNVLTPLDFVALKKGEGKYEIKKWEYFRQSAEEGAAQLEALWSQYGSIAAWEQRKADIRNNIITVTGLDRFPRNRINVRETAPRDYGRYSVRNMALEIMPGVWVCGSLYTPAGLKGKVPFMMCPHGHFYNKVDNSIPDERGRYRPEQQYRCACLAMMGAAVFSYDMWAWGESALAFNLKDHRTDLGLVMQTLQSSRILDYFCGQKWVDVERVGVTGASGGGTQTMIVAAIDDRIKLSVPVVMCSSHFYGGCPCESGLPIHIIPGQQRSNNAELTAMMAPKPVLVVSDGHDWTSSVPDIEYPYLTKVYGLYGARGNVENAHFKSEGHDYGESKRAAMYDFVARHWNLKEASEKDCVIENAAQMYVFDGSLPEGAIVGSGKLREIISKY